jgi:hypothetical protein
MPARSGPRPPPRVSEGVTPARRATARRCGHPRSHARRGGAEPRRAGGRAQRPRHRSGAWRTGARPLHAMHTLRALLRGWPRRSRARRHPLRDALRAAWRSGGWHSCAARGAPSLAYRLRRTGAAQPFGLLRAVCSRLVAGVHAMPARSGPRPPPRVSEGVTPARRATARRCSATPEATREGVVRNRGGREDAKRPPRPRPHRRLKTAPATPARR